VSKTVLTIDDSRTMREMLNMALVQAGYRVIQAVDGVEGLEVLRAEGADVVIEAVGGSRTLAMAFELVRGGGRISAVGVTTEETFPFPLMTSLVKDISLRIGLANIPRHMDATLALVEAGRIDPTIVISHRLPLEDVTEGYRLFDQRQATKVLLYPR